MDVWKKQYVFMVAVAIVSVTCVSLGGCMKHTVGEIIFSTTVYALIIRVMNKEHGVGKYTCSNGSVYEGEWQIGKQHGNGVYRDNLELTTKIDWMEIDITCAAMGLCTRENGRLVKKVVFSMCHKRP